MVKKQYMAGLLILLLFAYSVNAEFNYNEYNYENNTYDETISYLSWSLSRFQEDLLPLNSIMSEIQSGIENSPDKIITEGELRADISTVIASKERLADAMSFVENKISEMDVPSSAESKRSAALAEVHDSASGLSILLEELVDSTNSLNDKFKDSGYSNETLTEIADTRGSIKDVLDAIYDKTTIGNEYYLDSLSHSQLFLDYNTVPRITANVSSASPNLNDLSETIDIQFSEDIINKSDELSVPELFGFVKEGIRYMPYYGSLKGSAITLEQRIGNDIDQASLLIALLRSKGIHSRYALGTIEIDLDQALLWLDTKNETTLMDAFKDNGIPAQLSGDKAIIEHFWVRAYIDDEWIDLDPSFNIISRDEIPTQLLGQATTITMTDEDMDEIINSLDESAEDILADEFTEPDLISYNSLPSSLDYSIISRIVEYSGLPIGERHYATIRLYGDELLFTYEAPVSSLSSAINSLIFTPTSESLSIISEMGNETPAFLLDYTVSLEIDGNAAAGSAEALESGKALTMELEYDSPKRNKVEKAAIVSGVDHIIVFDPGKFSLNYLDKRSREYVEEYDSMDDDEKIVFMLYLTGLNYFANIDLAFDDQADINLVNWFRPEAGIVIVNSGAVKNFGTTLRKTPSVGLNRVKNLLSANIKPEQLSDLMLPRFMLVTGGIATSYEADIVNLITGIEGIVSYAELKNKAFFEEIGFGFAYNTALNQTERSDANLPNQILDQISYYSENGYIVQYIPTPLRFGGNSYFGYLIIDAETGATSSVLISTHLKQGSEGVPEAFLRVLEKFYDSGEQAANVKTARDWASMGRYTAQIVSRSLDLYHKAKFGEDLGDIAQKHFGKLNTYLGAVGTFKQVLGTTDKVLKALDDLEKTANLALCVSYAKESHSVYMCYGWYVTVVFSARAYDIVLSDGVAKSSVPGFFADMAVKKLMFPIFEGIGGEVCDPRYSIKTIIKDEKKDEGQCIFDMKYTIENVGIFAQKETTYSSKRIVPEQTGKFSGAYLRENDQKFTEKDEFRMSLDAKDFNIIAEETDLKCHLGITTPHKFIHQEINPCISKGLAGFEPAISIDEFGNVHVVYITGEHDKLNYAVFGTLSLDEAEVLFTLDSGYAEYLSSGEAGDELSNVFWDNGIYLSIIDTGIQSSGTDSWQIDDRDFTYIVKREGDILNVYEVEELFIGEPAIKNTLVSLGDLPGELHYPDILTHGYDTHISVNYNARVEYPVPGEANNFAFIMDWVSYYKIGADGTVVQSDVLEGWVGNSIDDPLVLGLGYGYMFDTQVLDSRINMDDDNNPVIISNVRVFYPSMWYIFTSQIRSIFYSGMFGGLIGSTVWMEELAQTITHITYWDSLRTATYAPGGGAAPDENWRWDTINTHSYSMDKKLGKESFWLISSDLKRIHNPSGVFGSDIAYLESHHGNYKLKSTFDGDLSGSVHNWKAGMDYSEDGTIHMAWQSGAAIYYYHKPPNEGSSDLVLVSVAGGEAKPEIIMGPNDWLYVVWIDDEVKLSYSKSFDGINWTEAKQITAETVKNFDLDSGEEPGSVYVTYVDFNRDISIKSIDLELQKTTIDVKCPVDLHLYKDGKHSGILPNGTFENEIKGVQYYHDALTDLKKLIIDGDTGGMMFEMDAFESGFVNVSVSRTLAEDGYGKTYYRDIEIGAFTLGEFSLNDNNLDYLLEIDYEGNGVVDSAVEPNYGPYIEIERLATLNFETTDTITMNATAFDAEDGTLSNIRWYSNSTGLIGTGNPINFELLYGYHTITSVVEDSEGEKANDSIVLFVDDKIPPEITINSLETFNTNVVYLDYSVDELIRKAAVEFSSGQTEELLADTFYYETALLNVTNGSYSMILTVEDLAGNPSNVSGAFTLAIDNYAPVLDHMPDVEIYRGELIDIDASGHDLDNDTITFSYEIPLDSNGEWQTALDDTGVYYPIVSASDGELTDTQIVRVEVKDRPPIFDAIDNIKVPTYGAAIEFDINAVDPEGEPVSYFMDAPEGAELTGSHFSWTPTMFQVRNHGLTFYAFDGVVNGTISMIIAVSDPGIACNFDEGCGKNDLAGYCIGSNAYQKGNEYVCRDAGMLSAYCDREYIDEFVEGCVYDCVEGTCTSIPVIAGIADMEVNEGEQIIVIVSAADHDGDDLNYSIDNPDFVQDENIFTWSTSYDDSGRYVISVAVSDGYNIVNKQFNVIINNINRLPIVPAVQEFNLVQGNFFSSTIGAADPDGDALIYELVPAAFSLNRYTGELTINPKNDDVGTYNLTVNVADAEETVSGTVIINIDDVNDAPGIDFIPPQIAVINKIFSYQVIADDADGNTLAYSDNTTLFDIDANGLISFVPYDSDIGSYFIEISASDGIETTVQLMYLRITQEEGSASILDRFYGLNVTVGSLIDLWASIGGKP